MVRNKSRLGIPHALALFFAFALAPSASAQDTVRYVCASEAKLRDGFTYGGDKVSINFDGVLNTVSDGVESKGARAEYSDGGGASAAAFRPRRGGATLVTPGADGKCQGGWLGSPGASISSSEGTAVNYLCGAGSVLTVLFMNGGDKVRISFPGADDAVLNRVRSDSGSRYQKGNIIFWTQGKEATLTLPGFDGKCTRQ